MKLPDFTKHIVLNDLRKKMRAEHLVEWTSGIEWKGFSVEEWKMLHFEGLDVPIEDIKRADDGTLEYRGQKVIVYIRDQITYDYERYGLKEYKYHIAFCDTLREMQDKGRFKKRYVVSRRKDGIFNVNILEGKTVLEKNKEMILKICKNCLNEICYEGFSYSGMIGDRRSKIYNDFSISEYFKKYDSHHIIKPLHNDLTAPLNVYPPDFDEISRKFRESKNWKCERCHRDFSTRKELLHTHHENGNKSDCNLNNLKALCYDCHSKEPAHQHMRALKH